MVHEDDDDKIRRNLVVMSVAILLVAFLDVPVQQVLAKAIAEDWKPSLARGWFAAFAVLFYFALRYRFDKKGEVALYQLERTYSSTLLSATTRLIRRQMKAQVQWWAVLDAEARRKSADKRKNVLVSYGGRPAVPVESSERSLGTEWDAQLMHVQGVKWKSAEARFSWSAPNIIGLPEHSVDAQVPVSTLDAARLRIYSVYHSWVYSPEATTFLAPVLLATAAAAVGAFKFTSQLIAP